jgi:Bifunctional DNA primase/polymerase, N-terminal
MRSSGSDAQHAFKVAAVGYATHGWPVVPASFYNGRRYVCVQADCADDTLHPVWRMWRDRASTDPKLVATWHRMFTFAVAVRTGVCFDVVVLPDGVATLVQAALAEQRTQTPVAVWRERGRRLFWVVRDLPWQARLGRLGGRLHGEGDWVPAPPTPTRCGPVQWAVPPELTNWGFVGHEPFIAALAAVGDK